MRADGLDALTSIKTQFAALQYPPQWIPERTDPRAVQDAARRRRNEVGSEFLRYLRNSLWVSHRHDGARRRRRGAGRLRLLALPLSRARTLLFYSVLLRNMFPAVVFLMPLFIMMRWLGLVNTHASLILTYLTFGLPLSIWLLKGFYDNIPVELEQAARIDGATRFQAFLLHRDAALVARASSRPRSTPSSSPGTSTSTRSPSSTTQRQLTLPVGLQRFFTEYATNWPGLMAASFIMSVPVVVLFLVLQKYFVRALTEGAVKS